MPPSVNRYYEQRFVPCPADENMATFYRDSLSELLFFISEIFISLIFHCDICGLRSLSFKTTTVLYITPTNNASVQKLVSQDHKDLFPL